jgi:hypothetical protein
LYSITNANPRNAVVKKIFDLLILGAKKINTLQSWKFKLFKKSEFFKMTPKVHQKCIKISNFDPNINSKRILNVKTI